MTPAKPRNVFYGCNWCGEQRAVVREEDIPLGALCSAECRKAFVAAADASDQAEEDDS